MSISWLHDAYQKGVFQLFDCTTEYEAADIFTKHFTDVRRWRHALDLIGLVHDQSLLSHLAACQVASGGLVGRVKLVRVIVTTGVNSSVVFPSAPSWIILPAAVLEGPTGFRLLRPKCCACTVLADHSGGLGWNYTVG